MRSKGLQCCLHMFDFAGRAVLIRCFSLDNVGNNFEKHYVMQLCLTRLCNGAHGPKRIIRMICSNNGCCSYCHRMQFYACPCMRPICKEWPEILAVHLHTHDVNLAADLESVASTIVVKAVLCVTTQEACQHIRGMNALLCLVLPSSFFRQVFRVVGLPR